MLTKKDLENIRQIVKEETERALTVEVTYERFDKTTGVTERKNENVYLPAWWIQHLPEMEGALRGMQTDVNKATNRASETKQGMEKIVGILLASENSLKRLSAISDYVIEQLPAGHSVRQISTESK